MWCREIDWVEPSLAAGLLSGQPGLVWLDSAMPHPHLGRTSLVAADPFGTFRVLDGQAYWDNERLHGHPLQALRRRLALYPVEARADAPPIAPGAIGAFTYEFGWLLDDSPGRTRSDGETARFGFYDTVIVFDHRARRCRIVASGWPAEETGARELRARARSSTFAEQLAQRAPTAAAPRTVLHWHATSPPGAYLAGVETVKEHIRAGDIYQANIAQRFTAAVPRDSDDLRLYDQLRSANPAPFAAFLRCGSKTILSSSPERLLRLRDRIVESRPIKGTARRAFDLEADAAAARALLASEKDRAENVMIVDLLRNDLARVCEPASVRVPTLCGLESYAGVHHLVSAVTGELRPGLDALDLVQAAFPGGSITGAPKLRAMEIIAAVESDGRGIYCGAIGFIGFDGGLDLNIAIRTIVVEDGKAMLQVGGGITLLSDARAEYGETLTKAQRIFQAFAPMAAEAPA